MVVHMRHTRAHTANRRSHHALKGARFETCKDCGAKHIMHRACLQCGKYRGRTVVDVLKKAAKLAKKKEGEHSKRKPVASEGKSAKTEKK